MVTSAAISASHSSIVRTACDSSMPMSHSVAKKCSMAPAGGVDARGQEHEHVDVGVRVELAAAVSADRDRGDVARHRALGEHVADDVVDEAKRGRAAGARVSGDAKNASRRTSRSDEGRCAIRR